MKKTYEFKRFDIVLHKSNDDQKLVIIRTGDTVCKCSWLDKRGEYHEEDFFAGELKIVEEYKI